MIEAFHFIRPLWLLLLIPLVALVVLFLYQKPGIQAWKNVCDPHLLDHLIQKKSREKRISTLMCLLLSLGFLIIAMAGPTWSRNPVPTFKNALPRVVVLDLSNSMLTNDLKPNRLKRAKYKLRDLFMLSQSDLYGLVVYTNEPFIVSPVTEDAKTIESLMPMLTPDIMPVQGQNLQQALKASAKLIQQAGFSEGDLLVMTGTAPSNDAVDEAKALVKKGIHTSVMPILKSQNKAPLFERLANAGQGMLLQVGGREVDLKDWLSATKKRDQFQASTFNEIPVWKDEGRWFLIPALLFLLPVFRRGWIQRLAV